MPACLRCGLRVPPVEEWVRENGRRIKPCGCGLPDEECRDALYSQGEHIYYDLVRRWARYGLTSKEIVFKVNAAGNHEWDRVVTTMRRRYGWGPDDPRVWAQFWNDLEIARGRLPRAV